MSTVPQHKDAADVPTHVAIIMDGNGRWAQAKGLPRTMGHHQGAEVVRTVVRAAADLGVDYLTLYGFSSENWKRPPTEVRDLMGLLRFYLRSEVPYLHENGVRLRVIGDRKRLDPDIVQLIEQAERSTAENCALNLVIAISYSGRGEIVDAVQELAQAVAAGQLQPDEVNEASFARHLYTSDIPDPDLLIRTSGEQRISNFLLWQCAYTEFVFVNTLWPDFTAQDFEDSVREYQRRERRFGTAGA
jgi:undecaprenyl diphosphate synthase